MVSGQLSVDSGQWSVFSEQCSVDSGQWSVTARWAEVGGGFPHKRWDRLLSGGPIRPGIRFLDGSFRIADRVPPRSRTVGRFSRPIRLLVPKARWMSALGCWQKLRSRYPNQKKCLCRIAKPRTPLSRLLTQDQLFGIPRQCRLPSLVRRAELGCVGHVVDFAQSSQPNIRDCSWESDSLSRSCAHAKSIHGQI